MSLSFKEYALRTKRPDNDKLTLLASDFHRQMHDALSAGGQGLTIDNAFRCRTQDSSVLRFLRGIIMKIH